ncbi:PAS domain-containing sensor histidine kinase [Desulfomicrobium sp. ZS1]|jgi:signal transduction histidine kinase|uniref:PAS domain-containing sensor histidine kinase n=1 Tax=Desulfomicrobium sp. ZS1 TaxID=2952228 RepID=UPI0020B3178D|nr:PAS domain-containing sensor histidine kinase [Desulfomicrobium sp. ZS1]UTF51564.1 PAS domain-containing sensor histidine kinase [Desulfomicrobium sp. ZS1]
MNEKCENLCAPGGRMSITDVQAEHARIKNHTCSEYFDFFPLPLLVLDSCRQIVFANKAFTDIAGASDLTPFLAKRPGEAMGCVYSDVGASGCGTSRYCRECGALRAILESMETREKSEHECQLLCRDEHGATEAKDLRVFVSPWETPDGTYYVLTLRDIGDEKRRQALERIFFHDILNSAGGARNLVDILMNEVPEDAREIAHMAKSSLFALVDEIQKQKQLLAAERNEYATLKITLQGLEIVQSVVGEFRTHPKALGKNIHLDAGSVNVAVSSDFSLLRRILVNMLINALEATQAGGIVTAGLRREKDRAVFWVGNPAVMEKSVRLQVFKRSFSTKGQDRGLGTYSIKLLAENYLGGEVGFSSEEPAGTIFWVSLPAL